MKKTIVKMLGTVALGATLISCAGGLLNAADIQAAAAGKVTVDPYIEYMFDDDENKANNFKNSGTSASDSSKDYTLGLMGNVTAENLFHHQYAELEENGALYLDGDNNPFANGDLTDFTFAMQVTPTYSEKYYSSVVSWDGITGDSDNADVNGGDFSGHKFMRVSVASKKSESDWLRFMDSQSLASVPPHWESYYKSKGAQTLYTGDRELTISPKVTVIISVDKDSKITAASYQGSELQQKVVTDLTGKNWNLYESDATYKRFMIGGAYDSRENQHLQMKATACFDSVRVYDFAMNDNEMQQYASSSGQGLLVSGVEIDKDLVGGTITVENNRPAVGEEVILNVTPDANARVDKVFVDNEEIAPVGGVYKTTMKADGIFVSADFVRNFAVNIDSAITNGTLTADKTTAEEGETVTFTLTPESGYGVKEVKVNGAPIQAVNGVYSAVMLAADMNVTAEFAKQCSVTVKADIKGGTVTVNKSSVWSGDMITITPKPDEGYEIRKVTVNGVEVQKTGIIYKFNVTEDSVVDVQFGIIGGGGGCSGSLAIGGMATGLTALGAAAIVLLCKKRK